MKNFFTLTLCFFTLSLTAQEPLTYPYNPDANGDTFVGVSDVLEGISTYDNFFFPEEIMVGDTTLSNWIQILNQTLANQQTVIDSLQASLASQDTQLDSTMIADMIAAAGGLGGGGCDYAFPEGLYGTPLTGSVDSSNPYTVEEGKNLYILTWQGYNPTIQGVGINAAQILPVIVKSGDELSNVDDVGASRFLGILVDATQTVSVITQEVNADNPYIVEEGKKLYVTSYLGNGGDAVIENLSGTSTTFTGSPYSQPWILNSGETIKSSNSNNSGTISAFNGYLVDEDYFADCGGGGGSGEGEGDSSSSQFNNQISNYNNILNQSITSSILDYIFSDYPNSITYTVPSGKIMKITSTQSANYGSTNPLLINGNVWTPNASIPDLLSEGTQLEIQFNSAGDFMNIQYDLIDNTQGLMLQYIFSDYPNSITYTVPSGKIMKITSTQSANYGSTNPLLINGNVWTPNASIPDLLSEGTQLEIQFNSAGDFMNIQYILFDN